MALNDNLEMRALADEHRTWLSAFDPQYSINWERLLKTNDEAAMTEAGVRGMLQRFGATVEPNEDLVSGQQRPDFKCVMTDCPFYVEVTHISMQKAKKETRIPLEPSGPSGFRGLTDAIFKACKGKAEQCSHADAPVLLAIGTWHAFTAMATFIKPLANMILTGQARMAWNIDVSTGQQVGETDLSTGLYSSAFLKPDETEEIDYARRSISALLLIGLGLRPPKVLGLLHPNPARPFDTQVLPQIEFGKVEVARNSGHLQVSWG